MNVWGRVCSWTSSHLNYDWEGMRKLYNLMNMPGIYSAGTARLVTAIIFLVHTNVNLFTCIQDLWRHGRGSSVLIKALTNCLNERPVDCTSREWRCQTVWLHPLAAKSGATRPVIWKCRRTVSTMSRRPAALNFITKVRYAFVFYHVSLVYQHFYLTFHLNIRHLSLLRSACSSLGIRSVVDPFWYTGRQISNPTSS